VDENGAVVGTNTGKLTIAEAALDEGFGVVILKTAVGTAKAQRTPRKTPRFEKYGFHPEGDRFILVFSLKNLAILAPRRFKCSF